MTLRLVIPAGASSTDIAFPDIKGDLRTWADIARRGDAESIEEFGSPWCVEHCIDGTGLCTEESGQPSPAQVQANEDAVAAAAKERFDYQVAIAKAAMGDMPAQVQAMVTALADKGVFSAKDVSDVMDATSAEARP